MRQDKRCDEECELGSCSLQLGVECVDVIETDQSKLIQYGSTFLVVIDAECLHSDSTLAMSVCAD